jgi:hypothetical protein
MPHPRRPAGPRRLTAEQGMPPAASTPGHPPAGKGTPPEGAGPAIQLTITGDGNHVTITTPGREPQERRFWTWRRAGAIIVGLATIAGAIAAILALHPF